MIRSPFRQPAVPVLEASAFSEVMIGVKPQRRFREINLNAAANQFETVRQGTVGELTERPLQFVLPPFGIHWIAISR